MDKIIVLDAIKFSDDIAVFNFALLNDRRCESAIILPIVVKDTGDIAVTHRTAHEQLVAVLSEAADAARGMPAYLGRSGANRGR